MAENQEFLFTTNKNWVNKLFQVRLICLSVMKRRLWFKRSLFLKSDVLGFCIVTSYEKLIPGFGKRLPDLVGMQISKIGNNFHGRKLLYKIVTDELMEISMYSCAKVLCLPFVSFCVVCYTTFALTEGR